ncbi:SDR family oxidoreductase [Rhizobium sp. NFR03]|uniref:SDR family oxidoreductase n=1 Tax=Rhizobium sp. NFR03 TaxID=1566263 RepID=UPI0008CAAD9E|nr:SDR family oxidoreductase [Rhizobium sp. NFR03]SES39161.1 3-oxoacyl-[acyl-carrier protein] reductase [Rhizobium sp. NFR03]
MSETILVTGGSKGIGAAIVEQLARERDVGTFVTIARRSNEYGRFIERNTSLYPDKNFIPLYADIGNRDQLEFAMDELARRNIRVDTVVNNAGYTNPKSVNEINIDDFLYTLKTNLVAPFSIVQTLIKRGQPPRLVINIASTAGINGRPGWLTYSASKAGLINMTEVLREELKVYGTRVVCVSPGRCATDLRKTLAPDEDPATIMQPSDVARVISVLVSEVGHLIDSQNLVVRT